MGRLVNTVASLRPPSTVVGAHTAVLGLRNADRRSTFQSWFDAPTDALSRFWKLPNSDRPKVSAVVRPAEEARRLPE